MTKSKLSKMERQDLEWSYKRRCGCLVVMREKLREAREEYKGLRTTTRLPLSAALAVQMTSLRLGTLRSRSINWAKRFWRINEPRQ